MNSSACLFCVLSEERVFLKNDLALALWDAFPVTEMHVLVVPIRHVEDYFSLTAKELVACDALLRGARALILKNDAQVEGFNVGSNIGGVAGQTIFHCHIHLIPRRTGDVHDPRGGIRHIIPGKGHY